MKNQLFKLVLSCMIFASCQVNNKPIIIKKIDLYNKVDSSFSYNGKIIRNKSDFFIVENFQSKQKDSAFIFNFIRDKKKYKEFDVYCTYFYKASSITNLKEIMLGPGEITAESDENDLLYCIISEYGRWRIHSYKSGKQVYTIYRDSL